MPSIQPLPRTLHLQSSVGFYLHTSTNPNMVVVGKSVVDVDVMTCVANEKALF
jgi:hypothetical protein